MSHTKKKTNDRKWQRKYCMGEFYKREIILDRAQREMYLKI